MMNKYRDVFESILVDLTETPNDKQFLAGLKFKWGRSDEQSKNNTFYPDAVATSAISALNTESQKGVGIVGQLDHPVGTAGTLLANASHLITKAWKDKEKVWWAEAKVMRTSKGRDLLTVLKTGAKIGASLRGFGEIASDGKVKAGLQIRAIDFVSTPSFGASATVDKSNVFESYVPDKKYEFNEEDLTAVTNAMDELNDEVVAMIQEKLKTSNHVDMTKGQIKALPIWIRMSKSDPNIAPFHEWFKEQQKTFGQNEPQDQWAINDELYRQSIVKNEGRIAREDDSANTLFASKKRIEERQKEIDEALALSETERDEKTIGRFFAEACLAGFKGSRAEFIKLRSKFWY